MFADTMSRRSMPHAHSPASTTSRAPSGRATPPAPSATTMPSPRRAPARPQEGRTRRDQAGRHSTRPALDLPATAPPAGSCAACGDRPTSAPRRERADAAGAGGKFTVAELAVLRIVGDEVRGQGACALTLAEIAARAGVCRTDGAGRHPAGRRGSGCSRSRSAAGRGEKNLPNVVRIVSREWLRLVAHRGQKKCPHGQGSIKRTPRRASRKEGSAAAARRTCSSGAGFAGGRGGTGTLQPHRCGARGASEGLPKAGRA